VTLSLSDLDIESFSDAQRNPDKLRPTPKHSSSHSTTPALASRISVDLTAYAAPRLIPFTTAVMPPKQLNGKGRTLAEPNFAQTTLRAFTDKENRSVVTAVGMFAVSRSSSVK
jgi:hypothetical protein